MRTDAEVRAEVHALWMAVFGEPIVEAPPGMLIDTLIASLPEAGYETVRRVGVTLRTAEAHSPDHSAAGSSGPPSP